MNRFALTSKMLGVPVLGVLVSTLTLYGSAVIAAPGDEESAKAIEEVVSLGSRSSRPRTAADSTVPIDSISGDQFGVIGSAADITDNLKTFVPSYTATPATGDGSAFVRPTSLRGLAPDQTLVLVNGKRRHRSALVHFFAPAAGNGAHGPDIGMIPSIALKRVDILRDGASSQYGSDAIAGVMNFVLKDASEGGDAFAQYGQFYEGEQSVKVAGNIGLPVGDAGFFNVSAEFVDNEALSRGVQRPDAQALIDAGVAGVGADTPFDDEPFAQTWGRPENGGIRLFFNSGYDISAAAEAYLHGNYAETQGTYRFFYRNPNHSTITTLALDPDFTGLPAGYTPYLEGDQTDLSIVGGVKGEFNTWNYDASVGFGSNELEYTLNNTTNPSLDVVAGVSPLRDFDVGGYKQSEVNVNADFSKMLTDTLNLALGVEWREETYEPQAGEVDSSTGSGSNGLGGIKEADAEEFSRDNTAVYAELEKDISDDLLVQGALRFEDFSDFGNTTNGKLASRFRINDGVAIRGSVSTGFHAPTPGQANVQTTITTFDGKTGLQVEEGLIKSTSPLAVKAGGKELTEEKSVNLSLGVTANVMENGTLTADIYKIDVTDRIYRTGDITVKKDDGSDATISFYTNALDITSQGLDLVYTHGLDWGAVSSTNVSLALNVSKLTVEDQTAVNGINPVSDATVEDIENNYPETRWVLSTNTRFNNQWNLMVRANYYGSHFDERGTIDDATSPSAEIDPVVYFDAEVGFQLNDALKLAAGGTNIFDEFIDEIDAPNANRQSVGLQYPRRSAANYEGGSWYLSANYSF